MKRRDPKKISRTILERASYWEQKCNTDVIQHNQRSSVIKSPIISLNNKEISEELAQLKIDMAASPVSLITSSLYGGNGGDHHQVKDHVKDHQASSDKDKPESLKSVPLEAPSLAEPDQPAVSVSESSEPQNRESSPAAAAAAASETSSTTITTQQSQTVTELIVHF